MRAPCSSALAGRLACGLVAASLALLAGSAADAADPKARIAFVGDSLAQNYWAGVTRLVAGDSCLKSNVDLGRFGKPATGLANGAYFNWLPEIRRVSETVSGAAGVGFSLHMQMSIPFLAGITDFRPLRRESNRVVVCPLPRGEGRRVYPHAG